MTPPSSERAMSMQFLLWIELRRIREQDSGVPWQWEELFDSDAPTLVKARNLRSCTLVDGVWHGSFGVERIGRSKAATRSTIHSNVSTASRQQSYRTDHGVSGDYYRRRMP